MCRCRRFINIEVMSNLSDFREQHFERVLLRIQEDRVGTVAKSATVRDRPKNYAS